MEKDISHAEKVHTSTHILDRPCQKLVVVAELTFRVYSKHVEIIAIYMDILTRVKI